MSASTNGKKGGLCAKVKKAVVPVLQVLTLIAVVVGIFVTMYINKPGSQGSADKPDTSFCGNSPCQNGGSCSESGKTYACQCTASYLGRDCEFSNPCSRNPCQYGGNCSISGDSFVCKCPIGYSGAFCETAKDPCDSNPCQNVGTCSRDEAGYRCTCKVGFIGKTCESADVCQSNPCKNAGNCSISGNMFHCACPGTHFGTICENDRTEEATLTDNRHMLYVNFGLGIAVLVGVIALLVIAIFSLCIWRKSKSSQ